MAFVQAMNTQDLTKKGVNGADVYTEEGVGDYRVTLFTMLNRGLEASYIQDYVEKIYSKGVGIVDLFVMAFQTRDIRGGKGEKKLFYNFMNSLYSQDKSTVVKMLELVQEYGCWRDMWELWETIPELEASILRIVKRVFFEDIAKLDAGEMKKMSLLAKWLPREKSASYKGMAKKIAGVLCVSDSEKKRMMFYRKECSRMNKALKTIEINMCSNTWKDIAPDAVPGRCLKIHNKAFLNESSEKKKSGQIRFPDSEDRMECRAHFQAFIEAMKKGEKTAHGANVVNPHELVEQIFRDGNTADVNEIIQAQWNSIREETLKLGGLGKCVPMCDFSGSMSGIPKLVSFALGVLISEINHSSFRDHILTFDAEPKWHSFTGHTSLKEKIGSIDFDLGQGLNTNFYRACMRILEKMVQHKVPLGEEPDDLIVLTDMGFDNAATPAYTQGSIEWDGQIQRIRTEFQRAGEKLWGVGNGWKAPRIVIWNLRAEFKDFHAKADQEGVVQLSGWSPSILKALQKGGVQLMTPYQGMRLILDDARYDAVRRVFDTSTSAVQV